MTHKRTQTILRAHEDAGARDLDETMRAVALVLPNASVREVLIALFTGAESELDEWLQLTMGTDLDALASEWLPPKEVKCKHLDIAHCGSIYACLNCGQRDDEIRKLYEGGR